MQTATHRSKTVGQLVLVDVDPARPQVNRAIAGFLAGYSGATLEAYRLDLRQWVGWLDAAGLGVFVVERAHIELCARWCESEGKAPATIGRRLSTICGFYNYCAQERLVDRNPAAHVRRVQSRTTSRRRSAPIATSSERFSYKPDCPSATVPLSAGGSSGDPALPFPVGPEYGKAGAGSE